MEWWSNLSKKGKGGVGCLVIILVLVLLVYVSGTGDGDVPSEPVSVGPTVEPTPAPTAPAWDDIEAFRDQATDVQWERFVEGELTGSLVENWVGYVYEIEERGEGLMIVIDLDGPDETFSTPEVKLETDSPEAINWFKGTPVLFSGIVSDVSHGMGEIFDVTLEDAVIETAE